MRISKPGDENRGRRDERRRARERAREARRRREELERRAAELQTSAQKQPAAKASAQTEKERARSEPDAAKWEPKAAALQRLPGELSRRLSLPGLVRLLAPIGGGISRLARLVAFVIFAAAALVERVMAKLLRVLGPRVRRAVERLGRLVTPKRAAIAVAAAAGAAVLAAQVIDYRAVAISSEAYADVASLAQAPLAEHRTPWAVHGPLVGLLAIVAAVAAVAVLRGAGRRALIGALGAAAAGLLVILGFDLPRAGNLEQAAAEYADTDAVLLSGFYIQLSAMVLLGLVALMPALWRRKVG